MPNLFTCPKGHQWELSVDEGLAGIQTSQVCPICGTMPSMPVKGSPPKVLEGSTIASAGVEQAYPISAFKSRPPYIPGYELLSELGQGGMGVVYKARQNSHDRMVAIKVIRRDRLFHAEAVRRFRREAQATARLSHPNIVLVYEASLESEPNYLVMEFVDGSTLQTLVEQRGPLPIAKACDYMRQAVLGLQHAWEQALVHRDIKPVNLMVTRIRSTTGLPGSVPGEMVKILDMGVARLYQREDSPLEALSTLTQPGAVIGTADFIAPEQLEDPHGADYRADLYSLGCTFYYLLTGQVPFPGGSLIQKLDRQRWQTPLAVEQLRPDIPAPVAAVVRKLMAKKPKDRYQTGEELASDLDQAVRGGRISIALHRIPVSELRRFSGHSDAIWSAAFSPDGQFAASASKDRTVRLWDVASGKQLRILAEQSQEIRSVAFSPTGSQIAFASGASIRLVEVASGRELLRFMGHSDIVREVSFAPDGVRLVSCGDDRTVRVWDTGTGREILRFARHRGGLSGLAISTDGEQVLSGGRDTKMRLWNIRNGQEIRTFHTPHGYILSVALSRNGLYALTAHFDTNLRLWDVHSGRELRRFQGHRQMVTSAAFTPDDQLLVSGSKDQSVRLWDLHSGGEVCTFAGHNGGVTCVRLSPTAPLVLSASLDQTLRLWPLPNAE